jgi:hypothetical protein
MSPLEKFNRFVQQHPHHHKTFFNRPHISRRAFFELAGAGVAGSFLLPQAAEACTVQTQQSVTTINKAKNVIFILLAGAPSHTDLFDMKDPSITGAPSTVNATMVNQTLWPMGLMPKVGGQLGNIAIVRSMQAWALVHSLAQTWTQIGRNPAAALGNIAPNIGSVVAIETAGQATASQVFPTFLGLNSPGAISNGYFPANYAPFKIVPATTGVPNTSNSLGQPQFNTMWSRLHQLDDPLRDNSPLGQPVSDYEAFYESANRIMYNASVQKAFTYAASDSARYGSTAFGNACLVAKQVLEANQGTRFVQITLGGWDMHVDIYGEKNPKGTNLFTLCPQLDNGVGTLLADLQANGLFDSTLLVMVGEFGRTTGAITPALGRDHLPQQSIIFAGAGVTGGKIIGATNTDGSDTADFGWSQQRYVKPEDVEATIYSAMGINWTTVRCDDPFHRGFEYVPFSAETNIYQPINELWT